MSSAADYLPSRHSLGALGGAVQDCRGCPLYQRATQAVFGEGRAHAAVVLVGEQPGDEEDTTGHPFVGPAGRLLDHLLDTAGISRRDAYVTNAVKHFKWERRGKRRLHKKPSSSEIESCRPWLEAELDVIRPRALVLLGATAAQSLMGRSFRVTRERGRVFASQWAPLTMATVHPSALLRLPDAEDRRAAREQAVRELAQIARALKEPRPEAAPAAHRP